MDRYLAALDAHDAKQLPLARGAKFTENTVALTLGDGFWQTIDKGSQSSTSRLIIADPATSQVAFYGAAKENGHGVLFGVRLKHKAQLISEIEQFVIRRGPAQIGEFDHPTAFDAAWTEVLPVAERLPRAELVRIANLYFEGIEKSSGDIVPLVPETSRVENGFRTAPRPPGADGKPAQSIRETFSSGMFQYIRADQAASISAGRRRAGRGLHDGDVSAPGQCDGAATCGTNSTKTPPVSSTIPIRWR